MFIDHPLDEQDTSVDTGHTKTNKAEFLSLKNLQGS